MNEQQTAEHVHAIEYVVLHGQLGGGSIEVFASNRLLGGDPPRRHRRGTPTDASWSRDVLLAAIDPAWSDLAALLCVLGGWDRDGAVYGRVAASGTPERTELRRAVETGKPVGHQEWGGFNALLHVRNWQLVRDADAGYFDFYFSPDADPYGVTYSAIENDVTITAKLASLIDAIRTPVRRVMQTLLPDPDIVARLNAVGIDAPPPAWEDEIMPVHGGGAYRFRFVAL